MEPESIDTGDTDESPKAPAQTEPTWLNHTTQADLDVGEPPEPAQEAHTAELEALRAQVATAAAERDAALAQAASAAESAQARVTAAETALAETHRRALLAEHRGSVIDELVTGSTPADLDASIDVAKAAHARIAESVRAQVLAERPVLPLVPAGASGRAEPDAESLSPIQKMTMALGRNGQA